MKNNETEDWLTYPTTAELSHAGVKIHPYFDHVARDGDLLERYLSVSNHAIFLYTSEDSVLEKYIRDHWTALDGLSGDACDIYVSLIQLLGGGDAYSQFEEIKSLPGLEGILPENLPALHIWSEYISITFCLNNFRNEFDLKNIFRIIFSEINKFNAPITKKKVDDLKDKISAFNKFGLCQDQCLINAEAGRDITQICYNFYGEDAMPINRSSTAGKVVQYIDSVKIKGEIIQESDVENTDQDISRAEGSNLKQSVKSEKQHLVVGKYAASGKYAVIGLVIAIILFIIFRLVTT